MTDVDPLATAGRPSAGRPWHPTWVVLVLLALGCPGEAGDDDTAADDDVSADDDDLSPGAEPDLRIEVVESRSAGSGDGYAWAGAGAPIPWDLWWEPALDAGPCTYFAIEIPLCDPPCIPPETCVDHDVCEELPDAPYVGTVTVDGLAVEVTLTAEAPYYYYVATYDPDPTDGELFVEGGVLTASAPGVDSPAFSVDTVGVSAMETELTCPPPAEDGAPLTVRWAPGTGGDAVRFTMRSGNHGNQFSSVVCDTDDTGELTVDAALLDAYRADFHPVEVWVLERFSAGQTQAGPHLVELRAVSQASCTY